MIERFKQLAWAWLLFASPAFVLADDRPNNPALSRVFDWLPADTETVIVAQGPLEIRAQPTKPDELPPLAETMESLTVSIATGFDANWGLDLPRGLKIRLAIEGSRSFRAPKGLGLMPYAGCQILQFEGSAEKAVQTAFAECLANSEEKTQLRGKQVAIVNHKIESDDWTFFIAHPRPDILLCATDQAYLEEVLQRMEKKPDKRALPADLPEWKHVNVKARVWALRHFRKEGAERDPSSPLGENAFATARHPEALGIVFSYDPNAENVAKVRYLSGNKNALRLVESEWVRPSDKLTPKVQQIAPGVVEISTSVGDPESRSSFLMMLLGILGHGLYV